MCMHMIDNSNNEIRSGWVKRDTSGVEKQLIKFAWPNEVHAACMSIPRWEYMLQEMFRL